MNRFEKRSNKYLRNTRSRNPGRDFSEFRLRVEDIIHAEGFLTRAGGRLPPEVIGGPEATVVRRLKNSGAIVFGKTVTVAFANSGPGPTRNPHHLDHTSRGSSSGAAAVAAGLSAIGCDGLLMSLKKLLYSNGIIIILAAVNLALLATSSRPARTKGANR